VPVSTASGVGRPLQQSQPPDPSPLDPEHVVPDVSCSSPLDPAPQPRQSPSAERTGVDGGSGGSRSTEKYQCGCGEGEAAAGADERGVQLGGGGECGRGEASASRVTR
jgi:hypothetical protein